MDFGKVAIEQLSLVDFSLPSDTELTRKVLQDVKTADEISVYVGCAKWGRKEWVGMIYPPKTKESKFLAEYVKHFNSIELNATFYAIPTREQVRSWRDAAAAEREDFKFCPKFSNVISHLKRLRNAEDDTDRYFENISQFGKYLGPIFLQLGDTFGPKHFDVLESYIRKLPTDFSVFVEVRHNEWFTDMTVRNELFLMLHELGKGAIITDASGRRDCVHQELPVPEAFIRFVGNGLHPTDYTRIDDWVARLSKWRQNGLRSIYFFLHQHDEKDTPILAAYAIKKLNEVMGLNLKLPRFIDKDPPTLFT